MPKKLTIAFLLLLFASVLFACATAKKEGTSPSQELRPRTSTYDFDDVRIPSEMKIDKESSFVYSTSHLKVGLLAFTGRVTPDSLAAFFQTNMPRDGWRPITTLKFRQSMLVFFKDDRACMITIREKLIYTLLEVWVGPIEQASSPVKGTAPR